MENEIVKIEPTSELSTNVFSNKEKLCRVIRHRKDVSSSR